MRITFIFDGDVNWILEQLAELGVEDIEVEK